MSVFKLAVFLAILATTRVAMSQDDTAWVLVCEHVKWEGRCAFLRSRAGQCTNVPGDWNDIISSVRNDDADIFRCKLFEEIDYGGRSDDKEENGDLNAGGGDLNNRISSWICEAWERVNLISNAKVDL